MELPRIPNSTTVTVPAVAEETYPDLFLYELHMKAPAFNTRLNKAAQSLNMRYKAFNYDTGKLSPVATADKVIDVPDFRAEIDRVPRVAQLAGEILTVGLLLHAEKAAQAALAAANKQVALVTKEVEANTAIIASLPETPEVGSVAETTKNNAVAALAEENIALVAANAAVGVAQATLTGIQTQLGMGA